MKKMAILFVLAVLIPSMALGWLALRSVRDQQIIIERQQSLLYQGVVDSVARAVHERLLTEQNRFAATVDAMLQGKENHGPLPRFFAQEIQNRWKFARIGFVVSSTGTMLSPLPHSSPEARLFAEANGTFLSNRDSVEVYQNTFKVPSNRQSAALPGEQSPKIRNVTPMNAAGEQSAGNSQQFSKIVPMETEFRKVVGEAEQGMIARFLQNKLTLLVWHRPQEALDFVYGAEIDLEKLVLELGFLVRSEERSENELCLALLNDAGQPVALSKEGFNAQWKRPFVASEVGEALPHWEVTAYLLNPAQLQHAAITARWMLGILIGILITSIGVGAWLIGIDINRQMRLARLKTDFVSNVSHELKTPLTSIRMFSELLADGRVAEPDKQRSYLNIINQEASRLTRLINNVLDFARMERGDKRYQMNRFDFVTLTREMCDTYRAHLEQSGFRFACVFPDEPIYTQGDRDALAQVIVNLLSNAEKYSGEKKEITVELERRDNHCLRLRISDRGVGIPAGCEEKVFEQFYRAHDGLNSSTQGTGLGLTLARQIARGHDGNVFYEKREGGGSCFTLELRVA